MGKFVKKAVYKELAETRLNELEALQELARVRLNNINELKAALAKATKPATISKSSRTRAPTPAVEIPEPVPTDSMLKAQLDEITIIAKTLRSVFFQGQGEVDLTTLEEKDITLLRVIDTFAEKAYVRSSSSRRPLLSNFSR